MVLDILVGLLQGISQVNTVLLAVVFLVFIVLAYKIFQILIKAFIVGVVAAAFPIVGNLVLGMDIPLNLTTIVWFSVVGVVAFMLYATVSSGAKIARIMMKPFGFMFRKKPQAKTVIIREKEPRARNGA